MIGYPVTYGDTNVDEVMLSDYAVELMKTKRFQSHVTAMFFALLALGSYAQPSLAIPPEYGEAANEILNQAAQNGAAGGVPAAPPIGKIGPTIGQIGQPSPTDPPSFYVPGKPQLVGTRAANTVAFTAALGVICLNAAWGEPVAILMCSTGLVGVTYKLVKEVVLFMAKNIN